MFADPYAWIVLNNRNPSAVLFLELRDLVLAQAYILLQHILDFGTTRSREIHKNMTLIQYPPRARSVGRQMVSH